MFARSVRSLVSVAAFASILCGAALLTACNTTSSEPEDLGVAAGFVYNDTSHSATAYGACPNNLSYVAYWGLRYANANGDTVSNRWLGVSVSATSLSAATWSVGTNLSSDEAESPANKASVLLFGVGGSVASSNARIKVVPFAGGDSVRVIGKNIVLQSGRVVNFNLTNVVTCGST